MREFNDVYFKVDSEIVQNGFWEEDIKGKGGLVEDGLKKYILEKISAFDNTKLLPEDKREEVSLDDLVEILGELIPQEEHFHTLRHLTHYLLNIAGTIQGYSIVWVGDNSQETLNNPLVTFDSDKHWDSLTTHEEESYVRTFEFAHEIFNNYILGKGLKTPQLVVTKKNLSKSDN